MRRLYEAPWFTFRFADARIVPRFHLVGVPTGRPVMVYRVDPATGERRDLLGAGVVGVDGWVDLPNPITVRAGDVFIAVPEGGAER